MFYKVGRTELFIQNEKRKFVRQFLKHETQFFIPGFKLYYCHVGGLFRPRLCGLWSGGELVRYCKLCRLLHDTLLS